MDCREFERKLDELIAKDAPGSLLRDARDHMARCEECRGLAEIARASLESGPAGDGLVEAVLERTTGSPCSSARELLAMGEDDLEIADRRLLDLHRGRCPSCRELGETLVWLDGTLRGMAEIHPDPGFLQYVLRATSGRSRPRGWLEARLGAWFDVSIRRPRFALEVAYVGAVVLWLVFGTAISPLRGVPGQALEIVQTGSVQVLDASLGPMADALAIPASAPRRAWDATAGRLLDREEAVESGRWMRLGEHLRSFGMHGLKALGRASVGRLPESREHLRMMTIELESIWNEFTGAGTQPDVQTRIDSQSQEA